MGIEEKDVSSQLWRRISVVAVFFPDSAWVATYFPDGSMLNGEVTGCSILYSGPETTAKQIEDAFKEFTARENIAIVLISQYSILYSGPETTAKQIEDAFKEFTARENIAIVLISQYVKSYRWLEKLDGLVLYGFIFPLLTGFQVANMIRFLVDSYNMPIPAILEIPSKDQPYDPAHDSVLSRVKYLFSSESVASGRR
ncbi:unnamed protein product [Ilex paraguariensis]|uniref:Uncharacterized protein n=1 Tax=Ilex paraguariensis TaxID=185542 RepID=A0ABC8UBW9_9AQUA